MLQAICPQCKQKSGIYKQLWKEKNGEKSEQIVFYFLIVNPNHFTSRLTFQNLTSNSLPRWKIYGGFAHTKPMILLTLQKEKVSCWHYFLTSLNKKVSNLPCGFCYQMITPNSIWIRTHADTDSFVADHSSPWSYIFVPF